MDGETRETPEGEAPRPAKGGAVLGVAGMILALVGMACSIAGPHIVEELYPPEKIDYGEAAEKASEFIADVAAKTGRKLADAAKKKAGALLSRDKKADAAGTEAAPEDIAAAAKTKTVKHAEVSPRERAFSLFRFAGVGTGILAMFLGLFGWVRGEDHRAALSASAMGFLAMAWVYIVAAIAIAVLIAVVGAFSN